MFLDRPWSFLRFVEYDQGRLMPCGRLTQEMISHLIDPISGKVRLRLMQPEVTASWVQPYTRGWLLKPSWTGSWEIGDGPISSKSSSFSWLFHLVSCVLEPKSRSYHIISYHIISYHKITWHYEYLFYFLSTLFNSINFHIKESF